MLISFTVGNYRSIQEPVTLSMVATSLKGRTPEIDARACFTLPDGRRLLRVAAIYGANASGKSNICQAIFRDISKLLLNKILFLLLPLPSFYDSDNAKSIFEKITNNMIKSDQNFKTFMKQIISLADTGIHDIEIFTKNDNEKIKTIYKLNKDNFITFNLSENDSK